MYKKAFKKELTSKIFHQKERNNANQIKLHARGHIIIITNLVLGKRGLVGFETNRNKTHGYVF